MYFKKIVKILYNLAKPDFFEEVYQVFRTKMESRQKSMIGSILPHQLPNFTGDYNLRIIVQNYTHVEALESRFHKLSKDTKTTQRRP